MIVTLMSTTTTVMINGVSARIWVGHTQAGIPVYAYVTRIAAPIAADLTQFDVELQASEPPPSDIEAIPLRLIL